MIPTRPLTGLLAFALMLGLTATTFGQPPTLQERLAKTTSLRCTFSVKATGDWKAGTPSAEVSVAKLAVSFINVNVDEGTADAEGNFGGSTFIAVRYSNGYLHLMQMQGAGPLYTTTVLAKQTTDGRFMAVHSRHEYTEVRMPGYTSRPETYLGDCALGT